MVDDESDGGHLRGNSAQTESAKIPDIGRIFDLAVVTGDAVGQHCEREVVSASEAGLIQDASVSRAGDEIGKRSDGSIVKMPCCGVVFETLSGCEATMGELHAIRRRRLIGSGRLKRGAMARDSEGEAGHLCGHGVELQVTAIDEHGEEHGAHDGGFGGVLSCPRIEVLWANFCIDIVAILCGPRRNVLDVNGGPELDWEVCEEQNQLETHSCPLKAIRGAMKA